MDRRKFLTLAGLSSIYPSIELMAAAESKHHFKVGICDWHINSKGDLKAFEIASELGFDGVQVTYLPDNKKYDLKLKETRQLYLDASAKFKVEIASMCMGIFNSRSFMTTNETDQWVRECLQIMPFLKQKIVLLAFFSKSDMKNKPELQKIAVERLKMIAPMAEKLGITLGLETWLNKEEHMRVIDAVGSDAVKVYYDTANMNRMGYDVQKEIQWLGKKNAICQIHLKENGNRLGSGKVDFVKVKQALEEIEYKGWLVIESAIKGGWKESGLANRKYVGKLFNGI